MQDELILSGKKYISSRRAASSTSYSQDYLGQLIRAKKIDAMMVGRSWFILEESLASYVRSLGVVEPTRQAETPSVEDKKILNQSVISDTRAPEIPASTQASTLRYFADDAPLIPELKKGARLDSGVIEESRPTFKEVSRVLDESGHSPSPFELIPGHSISSIVRHTVVTALLVTSVVGGSLLIDGESASYVTSASSPVDVMSRSIDILSDAYLEGIEQSGAQMASGVESFIRVSDSVIDLYDHGVQAISSAVDSAIELVSAVVDDPALATSHIRSGLSEKGFWIHAPSQISAVIASQPTRNFSVAERIALGVYKTFSPLVDTSKELFASLFGDDRQDAETVVVDSDDSQAVRLALEKFNQSEQAGLIVATSSLSDESVSSISTSTDTRSEVQAISSVPSVTTIAEVSSDSQVVETVRIVSSGITSADVSRQISQAVAQLEGQIRDLRSSNSVNRQNTRSVFESIDLGNIRDANVIDANITGSTFSGPKVTTDSLNTTGTGVNAILGPTYFDTDTLVIDSVNRRVGIGTTSPYAKLSVVGETVSTYFTATSTTATSSFMGGLTLGTDGLVYQQATKNVGIGTTSPNATLSILQSANGTPIIDAYRITDTAPTGDFINYRSRAGTSLFRVDNSGNLSAGGIINTGSQTITSVSGPQFRVQYDGSNEITTSVSSSGTTTLAVSGATPALVFTPQTDRVTSFQFTNAAALPVLSIDTQNQRVGVGTTSPSRMFSVGGNAFVGGNLLVQPTGNGPQLTVNANGSGNDTEFVLGDGLGAFWNISRENSIGNPNLGDLTFESSVAGTVLSLENSGFVGIGTTSPLGKLSIEQDIETASFVVGNTGSTTVYGVASPSLFVGGVNRDGRIGMGTAAPNARLEIYNTSPASGPNEVLRLSNGFVTGALNEVQMKFDNGLGTHDWSIGARPVGPGYFRISQSGSEYLRIDSSGKIGIGTTSPWGKLSINYSTSDVSGQPIFVIASSTASATTTQFIVTNSGNVGIGTSTPTQILTVARDTSADTNIKVMNTLNMLDFGVDTTSAFIQARRSFSAAATPLSFYVGNTEAIRIASSTGNVGIGTTTPTAKLSVNGVLGDTNTTLFLVSSSTASGASTTFAVANNGRVGIGTSTPQRPLQIWTTDADSIQINRQGVFNVGDTVGLIAFQTGPGSGTDGNAQVRSFVKQAGSEYVSDLRLRTRQIGGGMRDILTVDHTGNVGIGSTSPAALLTLASTTANSAFFEAMRVSNSNAAGSGGYIFFERPGDPTRGLVIGEQYSSDDNLNRPHVRSAGGSSEELSLRTGFGTSGRDDSSSRHPTSLRQVTRVVVVSLVSARRLRQQISRLLALRVVRVRLSSSRHRPPDLRPQQSLLSTRVARWV